MNRILNAPNILSFIRILFLIPFTIYFFVQGQNYLALTTSALFLTLDALDGYLARKLHQETIIGAMLDGIGDSLFMVALGIAYFYLGYINYTLVAIIFAHRMTRAIPHVFMSSSEKGIHNTLSMKVSGIWLLAYLFLIPFVEKYAGHDLASQIHIGMIGISYLILMISIFFTLRGHKKL